MATTDEALLERARDVLRRAPLIDGHNDVLWELRTRVAYDLDRLDLSSSCPDLMTDIPRARAGGLGGQFWSVYVPSDLPGDTAVTATLEQIDACHAMVARFPDAFVFARTAADVERAAAEGRVASMVRVRVMYAAPSRARIRSAPRDEPMDCPPSTPTMDATRPSAAARSTSAAVRANTKASGKRATMAWHASICSSVAVTAVSPGRSEGTYTDQNCPPSPPALARGMSVMRSGHEDDRSSRSRS